MGFGSGATGRIHIAAKEKRGKDGMNLLIVDDERMETEIIEKLIDRERFPCAGVYTAQNMEDAVRILRKYPVGIMLCDIEMPQGSGLELTKWVRENGMDVEVIFLTGHAEFTYATEALRLGAVDYLLKPVEQEQFSSVLDAVLEKMERPRRKAVVVSTKEGPRRLLLDQILYVERAGRRLRYYCIDGTVDSVSLRVPFHKAVESLLGDSRFCQCGSSFAFNFQHIMGVNAHMVLLDNGKTVAIPRTSAAAFKTAWGRFWLEEEDG